MIGHTDFRNEDIRQIVKELGKEFKGDKYHLLHRNCNHFTDKFIKVFCLNLTKNKHEINLFISIYAEKRSHHGSTD